MAYNVFGNAITDATLKALPEYQNKTITRTDRARVAYMKKNADNKDVNARQYVKGLRDKYGSNDSVQCLIYNATGDPVTFVLSHDFQGSLGESPFPITIENGQWGGFLHVSWLFTGSIGGVVYRGKNCYDEECDWFFAWNNPYNKSGYKSTAYVAIHPKGYYSDADWGSMFGTVLSTDVTHSCVWNGCLANGAVGRLDSAVFEGLMIDSHAL
ncbi:Jasmonate-induced protein [Actinidia chinensis var. chinensis]|uniref:Jasmonate-induced protein n=1 Tax=Actinidia chinensis var. chinensis TaxID=1590841 RepID=A0A2R6QLA0_ACTCC|nr:Jasmonate-induced protein [Actinidia chinensis var. chinensis]